MAASMATKSSKEVMHRQEAWMTAEFCTAVILEMNKVFREEYKGLGARVHRT
jgi:hypothetical protein